MRVFIPARRQADTLRAERRSSDEDTIEMNQADDRRHNHREQPYRMTIILTHNTEALDSPYPMLDMHAHPRHLPILRTLRVTQLSTARRAMWCLNTLCAEIPQVSLFSGCRKLLRHAARLINLLVGSRSTMPTRDREHLARRICHDLRLEGVTLLLAGIHTLLPLIERRTRDTGLETVNQEPVKALNVQARCRTAKALLRLEAIGRAECAQHGYNFMKEVLTRVSTDTKEVSDDFVRDVMAQVHKDEQNFLRRREFALRAATHGALALGSAPGLSAPLYQLWEGDG